MFKTSLTDPLNVCAIPVGSRGWEIGLTFAPGKYQEVAMTGAWARNLDLDLGVIRSWGARYLVTLIEPWEFEELRISSLPQRAAELGLVWHGLPITDGAAPDGRLLERWRTLGPMFSAELLDGAKIVVHCKGGLGRAGTVASMLLLESRAASNGDDAMAKVREVRPGAIETQEQESFIRAWADHVKG
ncbi:cyclin-dependent kinase inhibitor 3 family protein [Stenotrophomonas maltophilia]|uniref:cyclin-dependent kinase inhibitor 3 family protein n=1 Tax=Stenotrophomonas maltophilia TaxID=40324 RepID=UPI000C1592DD|nr:cyclin-dependent kinase inhibitor 3 family protein [Stenotrophomonas maltophilia]